VSWISDAVLAHLCRVADWPDLAGTRYEAVEKIGQGGMGAVFLARDRELDRPVALKVLHALPATAQACDRMLREARILARLEHPSIVPVHDAGVLPDGRFYYAMKLVRGRRLDERLQQPMPLPERLGLFQKICDAVAFAHAHGVVHRDLKPQNIMLGAFGEVLVLDWGVAKEVGEPPAPPGAGPGPAGHDGSPHTAAGTVLGTPGYMAPEQARGDAGLVDGRADVYALGGILYFLLTGRAPEHGLCHPDGGEHTWPVPTAPRRLDRSVPRPLQAICLKALAARPEDRYPGAADLGADVADFVVRRRVRAYREGIVEAALRVGAKYRTAIALVVAYLVMRMLLLTFLGH
jgi:serine/threonine protein kinase